jgi:hypothetical protein
MNRFLMASISFGVAFNLGLLFVAEIIPYEHEPRLAGSMSEHHRTVPSTTSVPPVTPTSITVNDPEVEFYNLEAAEIAAFPESFDLIDVFEAGGIYRESEVIAKTDERWLTLFERKGKYQLEFANAKLKKFRTQSYAGDENDVQLSFDRRGVPILAIRRRLGLKPGPVTTLYHRPSQDEIDRRNLPIGSMKTGYSQDFYLDGGEHALRVSRAIDRSGTKVGVLVLEHKGFKQVLATAFHDPKYGETIGRLLWVGDLNDDGKLDLYFDVDNEIGAFGTRLYLSSSSEAGKLVTLVAWFGTAGC